MKIKFIFLCLLFPCMLTAQSTEYKSFIVGEGVRIRSEGSAKGKEISKVHGIRQVKIVEEGGKWDDLEKNNMCDRHKWVKVKWAGDSTGWVYGKYAYFDDREGGELYEKTTFIYHNISYEIAAYRNYGYPVGDEEGLTGCSYSYLVFIKTAESNKYYQVKDVMSKENETNMILYSNDGIGEQISKVTIEGDQIIVHVDISYQEGGANATYNLRFLNGEFKVVAYNKTEIKMD